MFTKLTLFCSIIVDNNKLYSFAIQNELERELHKMKSSTVSSSKACFSIFHAGIYIPIVATLPLDKFVVIERHKITESLGGNGNGIIVESSSIFDISQWTMKRLNESGLKKNYTPFFIAVRKR